MRDHVAQIVFFSSYPSKGLIHDAKIVGGAAYTKKLLHSLLDEQPYLALTVYGERFSGEKQHSYHDNGVFVKRVWMRDDFGSLWKAVRLMSKEKTPTIAISYEINMVGGPLANIFFLITLLILRLKGKQLVFIPHQVVGSFEAMENSPLKAFCLNLFKDLLFSYISLISDTVITFEKQLAAYLPDRKKACVIPLAVEAGLPIGKEEARRRLGLDQREFIILYFGFLSPYKGIDTLLGLYAPSMGKLIIAGDGNPNHMGNPTYAAFVRSVKETARQKDAAATGFVPEELIPYYYAACDLVILPYRMFFSSSYPLSFAFSYGKPFLVSKALGGYFRSEDFRRASVATGLAPKQFTFSYSAKDLTERIHEIQTNRDRFKRFSLFMKESRSWSSIARKYLEIFNIM